MKKIIWGIIVIMILVGGFYAFNSYIYKEKQGDYANQPIFTDYKDISYNIDGKEIKLADGQATEEIAPGSASKLTVKYFGNEAEGDLNADGVSDIAFLLTEESGGSGTFFYAVVALKTDSGYVGTDAAFLGDRISPQTTEYRDGEIIVNYAERKTGEPMTASPSVGVSKYLKVEGGRLIEVQK